MDWKQIVTWLLTIVTTAGDKLPQTLQGIERIVDEVEHLISLWNVQLPLAADFQASGVDPELQAAEDQIKDCLQSNAGEGRSAIDFSRIKALLAKAKQLGILDIIMATLVQKIPLPA